MTIPSTATPRVHLDDLLRSSAPTSITDARLAALAGFIVLVGSIPAMQVGADGVPLPGGELPAVLRWLRVHRPDQFSALLPGSEVEVELHAVSASGRAPRISKATGRWIQDASRKILGTGEVLHRRGLQKREDQRWRLAPALAALTGHSVGSVRVLLRPANGTVSNCEAASPEAASDGMTAA